VPRHAVPALRRWALQLPALAYAGFDTPLSAASRVDFQQCILAEPSEIRQAVSRFAEHTDNSDADRHQAWQRVLELLRVWSTPSSLLHDTVEDVWLELDGLPSQGDLPSPSVFFGIRREVWSTSDRSAVANAALQTLVDASARETIGPILQRCLLFPGAAVSHLGVMLARRTNALRVNVKGLRPEALGTCLTDIGWPGDIPAAEATMAPLAALVEHVTVCLDVGQQIHPVIGFECVLKKQPASEPRWATFLDHLVDEGLCTPAKREGLLRWPATLTPATPGTWWPDHLLHASLIAPADRFSVLDRQLSHVKVVLPPSGVPEAKAYFGFRHLWIAASSTQAGTVSKVRRASGNGLAAAIQNAVAFLVSMRDEQGWWDDFPESAGGSDAWVTAFAGAALAHVQDRGAREASRHAWTLLARRGGPSDGWGFNANLPMDADATTWALRLADALDMQGSTRFRQAGQFLSTLQLADGGFSSYGPNALSGRLVFLGREFHGARDGWCQTAHGCITAAAAGLGDTRALEFLRASQEADGSWRGYWWSGKEYATSLAAEALARAARREDQPLIDAAVRWAMAQIQANGAVRSVDHPMDSAFATASCALVLTLSGDFTLVRDPLERAVSWLVNEQRGDGGWTPSAWMRVPAPDVTDPDLDKGTHALFRDERGVFTAARAVSALTAASTSLTAARRDERDSVIRP
ncbi:MAG: prenyltransferase/squalene oxidase repeat-containing protein, partial [Vicinamibacterales bacterium]